MQTEIIKLWEIIFCDVEVPKSEVDEVFVKGMRIGVYGSDIHV